MFEQTFKNIDDVLRKEAGCATELDYAEQISWILFLKYLDDLEADRQSKALLTGDTYEPLLDEDYRWKSWAYPKDNKRELLKTAPVGDDLIAFVSGDLFPYLAAFKGYAEQGTFGAKIGEIFSGLTNKFQSGYNLREVLESIDALQFQTQQQKHELSDLYETRIKNMGNAGRNGGEYYTPRPLIRAMVQVTKPQLGETIYDGACGSAGFLCEAYEYLRPLAKSATNLELLQTATLYGKEKKGLAYIIGIMNMILHGIEAPNIIQTNTLTEDIQGIQEKDRHDVILANPPFGGQERKEIQENFTIKTGETAFLFLQHFIKSLKVGGRGAVVIKNTFLSNADNASRALRRELLTTCNLHTVLDCPAKTFLGAGVKTVVLFFTKGEPTEKIWFYQLDVGRSLGKTNPLNDDDLKEFVEFQSEFKESERSWFLDLKDVDQETFDLSPKNPNAPEDDPLREPEEILAEIAALDQESAEILANIELLLSQG
ncbi:N-6 DNA methylase [Synechocystis salina]|uniref:site-specific DNA-methyltransferase (adenine-specific) n=1 Tax=Synechocystis salina LEGE 00031 TaxID=1828736 RepID=A0ABR9VW49_9SYNC|nr:N-6 DNA methylase [Synechocystis salina]MBE9242523.1 N-6 DNA methylase [Synechocystis salina LEGE 00041]MBE9255587.1 N-6 DNA methylase [Synechocystis salina LEGE 00031]